MANLSSLIRLGSLEAARVWEFSVCLWVQVGYKSLGRFSCCGAQVSLGGHSIF